MIEAKNLYSHMTRVSERYAKLKAIFDEFERLASSKLTNEKCTVKGINFLPTTGKNYFDVSFVGKTMRFSFSVADGQNHSLQAFVKCNPVGKDDKLLDIVIGEFSFNSQAETNLKAPEDDLLVIDTEGDAGYLVLHFLSDLLNER